MPCLVCALPAASIHTHDTGMPSCQSYLTQTRALTHRRPAWGGSGVYAVREKDLIYNPQLQSTDTIITTTINVGRGEERETKQVVKRSATPKRRMGGGAVKQHMITPAVAVTNDGGREGLTTALALGDYAQRHPHKSTTHTVVGANDSGTISRSERFLLG
jgi:hypothetical protein